MKWLWFRTIYIYRTILRSDCCVRSGPVCFNNEAWSSWSVLGPDNCRECGFQSLWLKTGGHMTLHLSASTDLIFHVSSRTVCWEETILVSLLIWTCKPAKQVGFGIIAARSRHSWVRSRSHNVIAPQSAYNTKRQQAANNFFSFERCPNAAIMLLLSFHLLGAWVQS